MPDKLQQKSNNDITSLYNEISQLIFQAKSNIQRTVNSELVILYWNIGKHIKQEVLKDKRADYGRAVVEELSKKLSLEFGRGFGRRNLFNMIKFYEVFPDIKIVQTVIAQLSWTHLLEIIKMDDDLKREFYITMSTDQNWSVRTLKNRISSMLYERTAISKKPDQTILNDLETLKNEKKMSSDLFFRDPYVLDFLNLSDTYNEKDLENAILFELEKFILEMGKDFAFLARQKRITVDDEDYYIDLLFYHRKMKRLVVIELKLDKFKPQDKGQVELYLKWLQKYEMNEGEAPPLGLILCLGKSQQAVELLELDKSGIHVGEYLTELPSKNVFEETLKQAALKAKQQLEQRGIEYEQDKKE